MIYKLTLREASPNYFVSRDSVLLSPEHSQKIADDLWLDGFPGDALQYDKLAHLGTSWDHFGSVGSPYLADCIPPEARKRLSPGYTKRLTQGKTETVFYCKW